jgi:hypothetical protein
MKKLVVCCLGILAFGFLGGCGGSRAATAVGGGGPATGAPTKQWSDQQVAPALCTGTSISTIVGRWMVSQSSGTTTRDVSLLVQDNATTLTSTCTQGNLSRLATAVVSSTFTSTQLNFQTSDDKKTGDRQLTCEASLSQGSVPYKITGRCLTIGINGKHTFRYLGN